MRSIVDGHGPEVVEREPARRTTTFSGRGGELGRAGDPGGDERHARFERDACGARAPPRLVALPEPLLTAGALGEHHDDVAVATEADGGVDGLLVALPPSHGKGAAR